MRLRMKMNWGTAIAAVYLTFAVTTVSFVVFAIGRPVELVSADYYEQALRHDTHMRATANADALGEAVRVSIASEGRFLEIALPRRVTPGVGGADSGQAFERRTGRVTLYRPSDRTADVTVPLALDAQGVHRMTVDRAARGRWIVKVEWRARGLDYYHDQALWLP